MLEVGMFDNALMPIRSSKPPLILLSFNLMLCAATSTTLQSEDKKILKLFFSEGNLLTN